LKTIDGVEVSLFPGKEHRFVVRFRGRGLSDQLTDADPQKENKPRVYTQAASPEADYAARVVNKFLDEVTGILKAAPLANTVLLRGFSKFPAIPSMTELYRLKPAAIANYPMYKGLARLLGMEVIDAGGRPEELFEDLKLNYDRFDFFYIHYKKTDAAGEDGNFDAKVAAIEEIDRLLARLIDLKPAVLVVTSDHSTPALLKGHSWHPNPFVLVANSAAPDRLQAFSERECRHGSLGRFPAMNAMPLMLAHAAKLKKFGA
jgi:2,3-bisphosphoglycerate-independent phosphoglycerate mutase